jgi:hypothetical protein
MEINRVDGGGSEHEGGENRCPLTVVASGKGGNGKKE